jgi:hypothetical protein
VNKALDRGNAAKVTYKSTDRFDMKSFIMLFFFMSSQRAFSADPVMKWIGKDVKKMQSDFYEQNVIMGRNFIISDISVLQGHAKSEISGIVPEMLKRASEKPHEKKAVYELYSFTVSQTGPTDGTTYIMLAKDLLDSSNGVESGIVIDILKVEKPKKDMLVESNFCNLKSDQAISLPALVDKKTKKAISAFYVDWTKLKLISVPIDSKLECRDWEEDIGC